MSQPAGSLDTEERQAFLSEIQNHLPAFLSAAASERVDPAGDVRELLNLSEQDLRRVIAVHVALSDQVANFVEGLRRGLRSPLTSSDRPLTVTQAVRGPIDWPATIRERASAGWNETTHMIRPARRMFDIPENRALVWLLDRLDAELRRAIPAKTSARSGVHSANWLDRISEMRGTIQAGRRHHWLRDIPPGRASAGTLRSLAVSRSRFYRHAVPDVLETIRRCCEDTQSEQDITDLLCQRYFEPERDWQLFELVVALRIARAFSTRSVEKRRARLLVGTGRAPYARYELADGDEVRLWYQSWPTDAGRSVHHEASDHYRIAAAHSRPDIVVQRHHDGQSVDAVLLELKASRSAATLGGGLLQMLAYLKDRPALFGRRPSAWLVAPPSSAFISKDPGNRELWAVDSDHVADAIVDRLTS